MKISITKISMAALLCVMISSCYKTASSLGSAGGNIVRFPYASPANISVNAITTVTGTQTGTIQINRDVADASVLDQAETITLSVDNTIVTAYNTANGTSYTISDPSVYSFASTNPLANGKVTVNFAAGEFTKNITFSIDLTKVPAGTSGFGLKIEQSTICKINAGSNTVMVGFIKNPLAGNYLETTGTRYNYTGSVSWSGPPSIPAGYTGTTSFNGASITATIVDQYTIMLRMGNVPDPVSGSAMYVITANASASSITYTFPSTFLGGYSNIQTYVVDYTPPSATKKAVIHLATKYNNTTGNAGNDRLLDETFTQQ